MEKDIGLLQVLLLLAGTVVILIRPSMRRYWYIAVNFVYTVFLIILATAWLQAYYDHYLLYRYLKYLLLLLCGIQAYRVVTGKTQRYPYFVLVIILLVATFTDGTGIAFYPARFALNIWLSLMLGLGIRNRSPVLVYLALDSARHVVSDVLKIIIVNPQEIYEIVQLRIDPLVAYSLLFYFVVHLYLPMVVSAVERIFASTSVSHIAPGVLSFPQHSGNAQYRNVEQSDVETDSETLESLYTDMMVNASISKREVLTLEELAIYLGITEEEAYIFVESNNLNKLKPVNDQSHWLVSKASVLKALED
jgi:hypothetical protein